MKGKCSAVLRLLTCSEPQVPGVRLQAIITGFFVSSHKMWLGQDKEQVLRLLLEGTFPVEEFQFLLLSFILYCSLTSKICTLKGYLVLKWQSMRLPTHKSLFLICSNIIFSINKTYKYILILATWKGSGLGDALTIC